MSEYRAVAGSEWRNARLYDAMAPGGSVPGEEDPPGTLPPTSGDMAFFDLLASHNPVGTWIAPAGNLTDLAGGRHGDWAGAGRLSPGLPSLLTGDPYHSVGLDGDVRAVVAHADAFNNGAFTALAVVQPAAGTGWLTILNRDDPREGGQQAGGWGMGITDAGAPRCFYRSTQDSQSALVGVAGSVVRGDVSLIAMSIGAGGLDLLLDGAVVASDVEVTVAAILSSSIVIGARHTGATGFHGALQVASLVPAKLAPAQIGALAALCKARVGWAADLHAVLQPSGVVDLDPHARSLMGDAAATITITAQPGNATAEVASGQVRITAWRADTDDSAGRYTLTDSERTSTEGHIRVTVAPDLSEPAPGGGDPFYLMSHRSAQHIPIGSGANLAGESHAETQALRAIANKGWTVNDGGPWGVQAWEIDPSWAQRTVQWAAQAESSEAHKGFYPISVRLPPARTGGVAAHNAVQANNIPTRYPKDWSLGKGFDGVACLFDRATNAWRLFRQLVWQPYQSSPTANQTYTHPGGGYGHPKKASDPRAGSSASGVFNIFGVLRGYHINEPGRPIPHGLQVVTSRLSAPYLLSPEAVLPANGRDATALTNPNHNKGPMPYGRRITLPHGTTFSSSGMTVPGVGFVALNEPTLRAAIAIYVYGIFPIDGHHPGFAMRSDQWVEPSVRSALLSDLSKIFPHLVPCLDVWFDGQTICGGGTPRGPNYGIVSGTSTSPSTTGLGAPWPLVGDVMQLQAAGGFDFNVAPSPHTVVWVDTAGGNDANPGTEGSPKATMTGAYAIIPSDGSGYQIKVKDGSVLPPFQMLRSGSSNTPSGLFSIVTESIGASRAKVVGSGSSFSAVRALHDGNPRRYFVIDGFEIDGAANAGGHCLDVEGAYGFHIRRIRAYGAPAGGIALDCVDLCSVTDCRAFNCTTANFFNGISVYHPMVWADSTLPGLGICMARNMSWGHRYGAGTRTDNRAIIYDDSRTTQTPRAYHPGLNVEYPRWALVAWNVAADCDGPGISAVFSSRLIMTQNTGWKNGRDRGRSDTWRGEIALDHCKTDIVVERNALVCDSAYEADAEAISVGSSTATWGAMSNIVVKNNILWDLVGTSYYLTEGDGAPTIAFPSNIAANPLLVNPQAIVESGDWTVGYGA